jgi:hypothetical protein
MLAFRGRSFASNRFSPFRRPLWRFTLLKGRPGAHERVGVPLDVKAPSRMAKCTEAEPAIVTASHVAIASQRRQ